MKNQIKNIFDEDAVFDKLFVAIHTIHTEHKDNYLKEAAAA